MSSYLFNSSLGIKLNPQQVTGEIVNFINADQNRHYKVIIGTDSQLAADKTADFVTAIVVYRVGNGGRYFWRRVENDHQFHTLRERMWHEALTSLEISKKMLELLQRHSDFGTLMKPLNGTEPISKLTDRVDFEIHIDVGENGATKVMIQELVGMIRANNFGVKTKPESYAASKVADRHV